MTDRPLSAWSNRRSTGTPALGHAAPNTAATVDAAETTDDAATTDDTETAAAVALLEALATGDLRAAIRSIEADRTKTGEAEVRLMLGDSNFLGSSAAVADAALVARFRAQQRQISALLQDRLGSLLNSVKACSCQSVSWRYVDGSDDSICMTHGCLDPDLAVGMVIVTWDTISAYLLTGHTPAKDNR